MNLKLYYNNFYFFHIGIEPKQGAYVSVNLYDK